MLYPISDHPVVIHLTNYIDLLAIQRCILRVVRPACIALIAELASAHLAAIAVAYHTREHTKQRIGTAQTPQKVIVSSDHQLADSRGRRLRKRKAVMYRHNTIRVSVKQRDSGPFYI